MVIDLSRLVAIDGSVRTFSQSPENPSGVPGGGARAVSGTGAGHARDLGKRWKISPSIDLEPGDVAEVANIEGSGTIRHIWLTTNSDNWRSLVLRAFWDDAEEPAVEVPIGDFFCNGWCSYCRVDSMVIASNPNGGFNSYWPMPFREHAKITVENVSEVRARLYYQVTYDTAPVLGNAGYFHAQWNRKNPTDELVPHHVLTDVVGCGQFVGVYMARGVKSDGWWGEGEFQFFIDDDDSFPTICGTGTDDYFGGAWNFDLPDRGFTEFSGMYSGLAQVIRPDGRYRSQQLFGLYRWHLVDPIHFTKKLSVDVQALGFRSGWRFRALRDDIATMAVFYLDRPVAKRPEPPSAESMEVYLGSEAVPDLGTTPPRLMN